MNHISMSKTELQEVVGGEISSPSSDTSFVGVEFDTRKIDPGNLFICLKGESAHGEHFLSKAFDNGASLAIVESLEAFDGPYKDRLVRVEDSLHSLSLLASWWRSHLSVPIIGVTGSLGKTTVKEVCAGILKEYGRGTASIKSFNNHIGVPYSLSKIDKLDKWAVLEMGMNHFGEISHLSKIARPSVALITTVAPVHLGFFNNLGEIAKAKLEILDGLVENGTLIINSEDIVTNQALNVLEKQGTGKTFRTLRFGYSKDSDLLISDAQSLGLEGVKFNVAYHSQTIELKSPILGTHNIANIAGAILAALTAVEELDLAALPPLIQNIAPPSMRLNICYLGPHKLLIDDSYNASPVAMEAALKLLLEKRNEDTRCGALLGDMLELGIHSEEFHRQLGKLVAKLKIDFLIAVGEESRYVAEEASNLGIPTYWYMEPVLAAERALSCGFDRLLVKGSRGIKLDLAVSLIKQSFPSK